MLVLTRKEDESIVICDGGILADPLLDIKIKSIKGNQVQLAFRARHRDLLIDRQEMWWAKRNSALKGIIWDGR